jgi:hypothetical protein
MMAFMLPAIYKPRVSRRICGIHQRALRGWRGPRCRWHRRDAFLRESLKALTTSPHTQEHWDSDDCYEKSRHKTGVTPWRNRCPVPQGKNVADGNDAQHERPKDGIGVEPPEKVEHQGLGLGFVRR